MGIEVCFFTARGGQLSGPQRARRNFDLAEGFGKGRSQISVKGVVGHDMAEIDALLENVVCSMGGLEQEGLPITAQSVITDMAQVVGRTVAVWDNHPQPCEVVELPRN